MIAAPQFSRCCDVPQNPGSTLGPLEASIPSFGHVKGEWPHLEQIRDPGELELELELARVEYNTVRLHAAIGYVTPEDEHEGRGDAIRQRRRHGLQQARINRIEYRRNHQAETP